MRTYTRKDVARLAGLSTWQVHSNERRLGLGPPVRLPDVNRRVIRYDADAADKALKSRGLLGSTTDSCRQ